MATKIRKNKKLIFSGIGLHLLDTSDFCPNEELNRYSRNGHKHSTSCDMCTNAGCAKSRSK